MRFNRDLLREFVDAAMTANVAYHAARRDLYRRFMAALDREGDIVLEFQDVITLRTFLTARDNRLSDDARLAFEVIIMKIYEAVAEAVI